MWDYLVLLIFITIMLIIPELLIILILASLIVNYPKIFISLFFIIIIMVIYESIKDRFRKKNTDSQY